MIAVFPNIETKYHNFFPSKDFIIIRSYKDIRGREINSVILMYNWANECSDGVKNAFEYLRKSQPELFKKLM